MKRYIFLRSPQDINKPEKLKEIKSHLQNGVLTYNLLLKFNFVAPDKIIEEIIAKFQVMKNKIKFNLTQEAAQWEQN